MNPETHWRRRASAWAGAAARSRASRRLIPWFARHYGVRMEEAAAPTGGWRSLQAFFTRELRPGLRPVADAALVAPCDGTVGACGTVAGDTLVQAKGHTYSLEALLAERGAAARYPGGMYATIYLAPGDYHRVHSPVEGELRRVTHVPGAYFSVNPRAVAAIPGLFAKNQRTVCEIATVNGAVAVVLVGACLVGGIGISAAAGARLERGGALGWFEFGSTVVVVASAGVARTAGVESGAQVRMGEGMGRGA